MVKVSGYMPICASPSFHALHVSKWNQEQKNHFAEFVHYTCDRITKETSRKILEEIMEAVDIIIEKELPNLGRKISCGPQCDNCCHLSVSLTNPEAKLALEYAKEKGIEIDKTKLKQQFILGRDCDSFTNMDPALNGCVFLQKDKNCGIYEKRPLACRTMYSVTDPRICNSPLAPDGMYEAAVIAKAEYIMTAFRSAIIMKYGQENFNTLHYFLHGWLSKDGIHTDTAPLQGREQPLETTS